MHERKEDIKAIILISVYLTEAIANVLWFNIGQCSKCSDFERLKTDLHRMLFVEMIMSYLRNKNQQDALFFLNLVQQCILYFFRIK